MPLSDLTDAEREVVWQCLRVSVEGPLFPEWEFQTLFGVSRETVKRVLSAWPHVDDLQQDVHLAINNSMNLLFFYPPDDEFNWDKWITFPMGEIKRVFLKWRGDNPPNWF